MFVFLIEYDMEVINNSAPTVQNAQKHSTGNVQEYEPTKVYIQNIQKNV